MDILIIGGARFVGRHIVEAAQQRGHSITLFNRGKSNPDLFEQVEKIHGDRDGNLSLLSERRWDAVVDTCGYASRVGAMCWRPAATQHSCGSMMTSCWRAK